MSSINEQAAAIQRKHADEAAARASASRQPDPTEVQARRRAEIDPLLIKFRSWALQHCVPTNYRFLMRKGWIVAAKDVESGSTYNPWREVRLIVMRNGAVMETGGPFELRDVEAGIAKYVAKTGKPWPE